MAHKANKTEHVGAKRGIGAYYGKKADAKRESKKARRQQAKQLAREELQMGCGNLNATRSNKLSREKF